MIERITPPDFNRAANPNAWDNDPEVLKMEAQDNQQARSVGGVAIGDNLFTSSGRHRMSDEETSKLEYNESPLGRHAKKELN